MSGRHWPHLSSHRQAACRYYARVTSADLPAAPVPADEAPSARIDHFRPDIQGLRGIAVLLVVLFHADLVFTGGFVGVDVFFVVSGFVITALLLREFEGTGRISMRLFYARRVRRILPAMAVVTVVTLAIATIVLSPTGALQWTARTAVATALFVANLYLYASGGSYFGPAEDTNPLLHMWSLGVEEQFYLILPGVMLLTWRLARRAGRPDPRMALAWVIGGMAVLSLLASWSLTFDRSPLPIPDQARFAFFGPVTRIWEFAAGALIVLAAPHLVRLASRFSLLLGAIGIVLVVGSAALFDESTPFPGVAAVIPVAGTVLLIVAGGAAGYTRSALAWRPLAWIGDLSYSWYLWHWPAIVFARVIWPDNAAALAVAALASLVPAWTSYRFLEQPIRFNRRIVGRYAFSVAAVCIAVPAMVAGVVLVQADGWWGLDRPSEVEQRAARTVRCDGSRTEFPVDGCTFRVDGATGTVLLVGDSHAGALAPVAIRAANDAGYNLALWHKPSCPFGGRRVPESCAQWQDGVVALAEELQPDLVVVANRSLDDTFSDETAEKQRERLGGKLQELVDTGTEVAIVNTVPVHPSSGWEEISRLHPTGRPSVVSRTELDRWQAQKRLVESELDESIDGVVVFDPAPYLCDGDRCPQYRDGIWLYKDKSHLTEPGSMLLYEPLRALIEQSRSSSS
jgi:peptidoglycan/LPS O-acetylase OafA/YrhL